MRSGVVYYRDQIAGIVSKFESGKYEFRYLKSYRERDDLPSISATLPKTKSRHSSDHLFPFFYGLLSEGIQKDIQCRSLRIDERDHFGRLLATCGKSCIGAVKVSPRENKR